MKKEIEKIKQNKGITLVTLVITIIVLAILTGVSINSIIGEDGVISAAQNTATKANKILDQHQDEINSMIDEMGNWMNENWTTGGGTGGDSNDTTPPTVSIQEENTTENSIQITVNATDIGSGLSDIDTYKYYINDEFKTTSSSNNYIFTGLEANTSYTIKVEAYDKAGNKGEYSITAKTLEKTWVIADEIPASDYGQIVSNYECSSAGVSTWRIFYSGDADGDGTSNVYLIADDYILGKYAPLSKGNYQMGGNSFYPDLWYQLQFTEDIENDYARGTEFIVLNSLAKGLLRNWIDKYEYGKDYSNMKKVAYMMDTDIWWVYAGEKAEYAIGGPTLEIFVNSYNETHPEKMIDCSITNDIGYQVKWKSDSSYSYWIYGLAKDDTNGIYIKTDDKDTDGMWIASPSAYSTDYGLMYASSSGGLANTTFNTTGYGMRPFVCLKSDVKLEKQSDGSYKIL